MTIPLVLGIILLVAARSTRGILAVTPARDTHENQA